MPDGATKVLVTAPMDLAGSGLAGSLAGSLPGSSDLVRLNPPRAALSLSGGGSTMNRKT